MLIDIGRLVDPGLLHEDHELLEIDIFAIVSEVWARVANLEHQLQLVVPNILELLLVLVIIRQLGGDIVLHRLQIIQANCATIVIIVHLEGFEELVLHVSLVSLGDEPGHELLKLCNIDGTTAVLVSLVHQVLHLHRILRILVETKSTQCVLQLLLVDLLRAIFIE